MTRQSQRYPVRSGGTDRHGRARRFCAARFKELAFGGLFSTIFLLSQSPLQALVIDDIRILSKLGEPLRAEVRVLTAPGETLTQGCFKSVSGTGELPAVGSVRLTLSRQLGTQVLRVTGRQPMREPMSEFVLQVKCAGSPTIVRSFLVMVDPPGLIAAPAAPFAEQPVAAPVAGDAVPRPRARPVVAAIEPGSRYLVRSGDSLSTIAARVSGRPDWSVWPIAQQIYGANPGAFLMGDPNRIAQGSTIYIPRLDEVDFDTRREAVTPLVTEVAVSARITDTAPPAANVAPQRPVPAPVAPRPQIVAVAATPLQAMQLTVALGAESRMKLRLRRQAPVVEPPAEPEVPTAATDPQPEPSTQPEPDAAPTPRVALPPQTGGTGWFGWLGVGVGLLLAFLLGALAAGYALRRRPERQYEARPQAAADADERHDSPAPAAAVVAATATPSAPPEPARDDMTTELSEEPGHTGFDLDRPAHTVEVNTLPELDLELPQDEPATVGEPETLEMPRTADSVDFELTPDVNTGHTGQHEVDFDLLEKAYSEDYVAQFIDQHEDQAQPAVDDDDDNADTGVESPAGGETARYYHLENRDPADDTPLPIELGEDEMTGEVDADDCKIVNFPKSSSSV